jgi:EmrB/QacA subfamily drug resistance transporter
MQQSVNKTADPQDIVYHNRYVILAVVLIGTFMAVLDSSMVSIALPTITRHFNVDLTQSQWTITGYLLAMTGLFIFFGKVSEYMGKVKMFMAGWAIFGLSSLACGLAPGLNELIAFRVVQGIGASMVSCIGAAIIYLVFPPQERGKALGLMMVVFGGSALVGPGLGGFITDNLGWQYLFFINVPLCLVLLALAARHMKIPETTMKRLEMDWVGAATLFIAVVSLMMLCTEVAKDLKVTDTMIACGVAFALSTIAFFFYESRCAKPLLDMSIFRNRQFTLPLVSAMLAFGAIAMTTTLTPFFFQGAMGYTASQVGLISMVVPLFMMFAAPASGAIYDRSHPKFLAAGGMLVSAAGMLVLGYAILAMDFWLIIAAFAIRGIGSGIFSSPNSIETIGALPREKTAIASSVQSTGMFMAIMVGVAVSCIIVTLDLNRSGYYGPVILAGQSLLAGSVGVVMLAASALCVLAVVTSALRNVGQASGQREPAGKKEPAG